MSTAQRTVFLVILCAAITLASFVIVFAAEAQDDGDGNLQCPSVPSLYVYVSGVKYGEQVGDKVNLYGKKCVDLENKDIAAQGHCVGPKKCNADLCDGKPCALPKLKIEDVRKAVYEGVPSTPNTPVPPAPPGSLLDQWMFSPTPASEEKNALSPSANSVGEILKQSDAEPGFVDKARESIGNFFFPQQSVNDLVELKGGTVPGVDSNPVQTTHETGGAAGTNTFQPYGAAADDQTNTFQQETKDCDWWCRTKDGAASAWEGTKNVAAKVGDGLDYVVNNVLTSPADGRKDSNINVSCADDPKLCPSSKTGIVSWYNCGTGGDSGPCIGTRDNPINPNDYTVASAYPDNTVLKVCSGERCVAVVSNDKGSFIDNPKYSEGQRVGDLTRPAFLRIADPELGLKQGLIKDVTLTPVGMYSDYASAKAAAENINTPAPYTPPAVYDLYGESTGNYTVAEEGFKNYRDEQADTAVNAIDWNSFVTSDAQYDPTADPALANLDWIGSDAQPEGAELGNLSPEQIAVREGLAMNERMKQADEEARRAGLDPDAPPLTPEQPRTVADIEAEVAKNKPAEVPIELVAGVSREVKPSEVAEVSPSLSDGPVAPQEGGNERVAVLTDAQVEQKVRSAFDQKIKDAQSTVQYARELLARSESPAARDLAQAGVDEASKRLDAVVEASISYSAGNPSPELQKVIERIRTGDEASPVSQGLTAIAEKAHHDAAAIAKEIPTEIYPSQIPKALWDMSAWGVASGVGLVAESSRNLLEKIGVAGFRSDTDRELSAAIDPIGAEWKTAADVAVVAPFGVGLAKSAIGAGVDAGIEAGASVTRSFFGDVAQSDARVVVRDSAGFATNLERGATVVEDTNVARAVFETPRPISPTEIAEPSLPRAANIDSAGGRVTSQGGTIDEALTKFEGAANDAKSLGSAEPSAPPAPFTPAASDNPFLQGTDNITRRAAGEVEAPRPSAQGVRDASAEIDKIAADARAAAEAPVPEVIPAVEVPVKSGVPNIGDYVPTYADKIRLAWNDRVTGIKNTMSDWRESLFGGKTAEAPVIPEKPRLELVAENPNLPRPTVESPAPIAEEARIAAGGELPVPLPEPPPVRTADLRIVREEPPAAPPEPSVKPAAPEVTPTAERPTVVLAEEAQIDNPVALMKPAAERPTVVLAEEAQIDLPIASGVSDAAKVPTAVDNRNIFQRGWDSIFRKSEVKPVSVVEDVVPLGDGAPSIVRDFEIPKPAEVSPTVPKVETRPGPGEVGASNPTLADAAINDLRGPASKFDLNPAIEVKPPVGPTGPRIAAVENPTLVEASSAGFKSPWAPSESLLKPWSEWSKGAKWTTYGVGATGGLLVTKWGLDTYLGGTPPPKTPSGEKPPVVPVVPDDEKTTKPPLVRTGQPCGPNDTYASSGCYPPYVAPGTRGPNNSDIPSSGDYCITSIDPVVVIPGMKPGPNCYNYSGSKNPLSSLGSALGQLLGKMFGTSSPAPTPTNTPATPPVTPPTATSTVAKPLATLIAQPTTVLSGKKSRLIWSSINTSSCELFAPGDISMATGTRGSTSTLTLATTTLFRLDCSASTGATTSAKATVTVQ